MPAVLFTGLPFDPAGAAEALGIEPTQWDHLRGGALQANLDVPDGAWRFFPDQGAAAWLTRRRPSPPPPTRVELTRHALNLLDSVTRLYARGLWCGELRLLTDAGWSRSLPVADALRQMAAAGATMRGISGLWSDGTGGATRVELFDKGEVWASTPLEAERWLLIAAGLADE